MKPGKRRLSKTLRTAIVYVVVAVIMFWTLAPLYVAIVSSFCYDRELLSFPPHWIPEKPTLENYQLIFAVLFKGEAHAASSAERVLPGLRNSFVVALSVMGLNLLVGGLAAYAFAWLRFRFKSMLVSFILLVIYVPAFPLLFPLFVTFQTLHLLDSYLAVILAQNAFVLPFTIWVLSGYFDAIPTEIIDAAAVDGCTTLQAFYKVALPLCLPGIFAGGVFAFMGSWNDFLFPLLLTDSLRAMTITPIIAGFLEDFRIQYALINASAVLAALPPVLLVLLVQRFLIRGLMRGAVKG